MAVALRGSWLMGAILAAIMLQHGQAIVEQCAACRRVSTELLRRLAEEKPRDPLDLRNRLDSQGRRRGKIIEFRLSEQRVHDLLDGLCNDVSKTNMLYTSKEGNQSWAKLAEPDWTAPSKPEEDGRRKELENYCSKILDEFEDDLIAALKKESGDLEGILCQQLAGACKAKSLTNVKSEL